MALPVSTPFGAHPLNILFVADGRSPIALNWMSFFATRGHDVHLVSTFPCTPDLPLASLTTLPVALDRLTGQKSPVGKAGRRGAPSLRSVLPPVARTTFRHWLGPLTLPSLAQCLRRIIMQVKPDLVHAMRIPFEGMLAALATEGVPLLISVWGNDFTLHARSTPLLSRYTRMAMHRADALHTDCQRDARLARSWGYRTNGPTIVLPGGGGVQLDIFCPPNKGEGVTPKERGSETPDTRRCTVINPRGMRSYVRTDTFFRAVPLVLDRYPQARFLCPAMAGEPQAERWLAESRLKSAVILLPGQSRHEMAGLFRSSLVMVSPSIHDGTPNTLLEAMACGCFPIAGDLESIREWITPGVNGLLVDPADPASLAEAILQALENPILIEKAARINKQAIVDRAAYEEVMPMAENFYRTLVCERSG